MLVRLLGLLLLISGCATPDVPPAASTIPPAAAAAAADVSDDVRQEAVAVARSFADFRWEGNSENAFHGVDKWRNRIDTPDQGQLPEFGWQLNGEENVGVPYQWGGFSSLPEFEAGVKDGLMAGHLPTRGQSGYTNGAVGVDCSGLVSRCWGLPRKQSTRSLPNISVQLPSYDELLPGDILNLVNRHTMLFVGYEDAHHQVLHVIEATARKGKVHTSTHDRAALASKGYLPLRYTGFVQRP